MPSFLEQEGKMGELNIKTQTNNVQELVILTHWVLEIIQVHWPQNIFSKTGRGTLLSKEEDEHIWAVRRPTIKGLKQCTAPGATRLNCNLSVDTLKQKTQLQWGLHLHKSAILKLEWKKRKGGRNRGILKHDMDFQLLFRTKLNRNFRLSFLLISNSESSSSF